MEHFMNGCWSQDHDQADALSSTNIAKGGTIGDGN